MLKQLVDHPEGKKKRFKLAFFLMQFGYQETGKFKSKKPKIHEAVLILVEDACRAVFTGQSFRRLTINGLNVKTNDEYFENPILNCKIHKRIKAEERTKNG